MCNTKPPAPAAGVLVPALVPAPVPMPVPVPVHPPAPAPAPVQPPAPVEAGFEDMPALVDDDDDDDEMLPPHLPDHPPAPPLDLPEEFLAIIREAEALLAQQGNDEPEPPLPPPPPPPVEGAEPLPDPEHGYSEDVDVPAQARRREVREALEFVKAVRAAELDGSGLTPETIDRLRNPPHALPPVTAQERAALRVYLARGDASEGNYEDVRAAIEELNDTVDTIPSYEQIKQRVAAITGICALDTDMCTNTCLAYTGPFADLDKCPHCSEPRYDAWGLAHDKKIPRRTFKTFPIGPQIQAMWASPEGARLMRHRGERTKEILDAMKADPNYLNTGVYDDVYKGIDYLREAEARRIKAEDSVLMFSIDGAQLYQMKSSDCWFFIWVLLDLPPTVRYKKRYVLPGGVVGGPNKPKNVDSFLFPGLHHLAALQRNGLELWDAASQRQITSHPYLLLATADGPGMAYLSGFVGHQGARGCRLGCGFPSRLKPASNTYYPAALRPNDYNHPGSNHPDVDLRAHAQVQTQAVRPQYLANLRRVIQAPTQAAYQRVRLETGIAKPSIFSGLPRALPLPACFGADLMHLITLNLTDLLIGLLRGTIPCDPTDDKDTWKAWAVLEDADAWTAHGKLVAEATRYLPGSFDRPPRNPALKINSGYKAWEFLMYLFGLGPGLLRAIMAPPHFRHYCKLVSGIHIVLQYEQPADQVLLAFIRLLEYVNEFEELYCQRQANRIHFVRQSIHALTHLATEVVRLGPGSLYTQWTLENFIGNITREMKQHVTPYANVSERAFRRCQVNGVMAAMPELARLESAPENSVALGDGYVLLRAKDRSPVELKVASEAAALRSFLQTHGLEIYADRVQVTRWARLMLPNGQIARTAWKEEIQELRGKFPRRARMVKVRT